MPEWVNQRYLFIARAHRLVVTDRNLVLRAQKHHEEQVRQVMDSQQYQKHTIILGESENVKVV